MKRLNLIGSKFGRLSVVAFYGITKTHSSWVCRCDCGGKLVAIGNNLRMGTTQSCGCLKRERIKAALTKHGLSSSPEYTSWQGIIDRCTNASSKYWGRYGGRGIKVCKRWLKFTNFFADMGFKPFPDLSIEREDNNGGYSPSNCYWATPKQQTRNRRVTRYILFNGEKTPIAKVAEVLGLTYGKAYWRFCASKALPSTIQK